MLASKATISDENCRVVAGEIYQLGRHRVMCGDSTKPSDVNLLMSGERASLVFTSPPYMQQRNYGKAIVDWRSLMRDVFALLPVASDAQVLVNLGFVHRNNEWCPYWDEWLNDMRAMGWRRYGFYVWSKLGGGIPMASTGRLAMDWEPIFHLNRASKVPHKTKNCVRAGKIYAARGGRKASGDYKLWSSANIVGDKKTASAVLVATTAKGQRWKHPAQFSVQLCREVFEPFTSNDDLIFEPFGGAGTVLIAAHEMGRRCYAMEIEPRYCDIILARWEKTTGQQATLISGSPAASMQIRLTDVAGQKEK